MFHFTPRKNARKPKGFLIFLGSIEIENWAKVG